jgi:hypothetical protein
VHEETGLQRRACDHVYLESESAVGQRNDGMILIQRSEKIVSEFTFGNTRNAKVLIGRESGGDPRF